MPLYKQISGLVNNPVENVQNQVTSGTNADAVVTKTGVAGRVWTLHGVQWSYTGSAITGKLTIKDGSTTIFEVDITATGPGGFPLFLQATAGANLVATLLAGGSGVVGKLNTQTFLEG